MKKYIEMKIEVVAFGQEDVITTSGGGNPIVEPVSDFGNDCYFDATV
ncbi:MAG: hypothetical protein IIX01_04805 [Clostridia bacterium]|nr:hypothetical protein [Clostridia bacterium]